MKFRAALFLGLIVLIFGGGAAAWFAAAGWLDRQIEARIERLAAAGHSVECLNRRIAGFPFRLGPFCDLVSYSNERDGAQIEAGALRTAAQIYNPGFVVGELDGPALITPLGRSTMQLDWASLRANLRAGLDGFRRLSVAGREIVLNGPRANGRRLFALGDGELHLRPGAGDERSPDLDVAVATIGTDVSQLAPVAVFDLNGDVTFNAVLPQLLGGGDVLAWARANGLSGVARNLTVTSDAGGFELSGPFQFDRDGLLSADFQVKLTDPPAILRSVGTLFPPVREFTEALRQVISLVPGGGSGQGFPVTVRRGEISILGILRWSRLPPLY